STMVAGRRLRRPPLRQSPAISAFSVVAPMKGAADASREYVAALADLARRGAEVLICIASPSDPAVALARQHWRDCDAGDAPILLGDDGVSFNPKVNNMEKGLSAARGEWIAVCDAGVLLRAGQLVEAVGAAGPDVGLVLMPKAPCRPGSLACEVECAF